MLYMGHCNLAIIIVYFSNMLHLTIYVTKQKKRVSSTLQDDMLCYIKNLRHQTSVYLVALQK